MPAPAPAPADPMWLASFSSKLLLLVPGGSIALSLVLASLKSVIPLSSAGKKLGYLLRIDVKAAVSSLSRSTLDGVRVLGPGMRTSILLYSIS